MREDRAVPHVMGGGLLPGATGMRMGERAGSMPWRLAVAAVLVVVATSACGGGGGSSTTSPASSAGTTPTAPALFRATLTAPTHRPRVNAPWTYVVRIRDASGHPLRARVHLQALFGGVPVGQIGDHHVVGVWKETINWPPDSVGHPLVFQAEVTAAGSTVKLNYPLTVQAR